MSYEYNLTDWEAGEALRRGERIEHSNWRNLDWVEIKGALIVGSDGQTKYFPPLDPVSTEKRWRIVPRKVIVELPVDAVEWYSSMNPAGYSKHTSYVIEACKKALESK